MRVNARAPAGMRSVLFLLRKPVPAVCPLFEKAATFAR